MLDEKKILAIQLLVDGESTKVDIANKIGVQRSTLYDWLNNKEFKAELDKRIQERKNLCEKIIDSKLQDAVRILWETIETTKDMRVKAQLLTYTIDRALGKPTTKMDIEAGAKQIKQDNDVLEEAFDMEQDELEE